MDGGRRLATMIINGLIALPYIDFNTKGNGYFTFTERKFAISTFLFGFVVLWVVLIVLARSSAVPTGTSSARSSPGTRTRRAAE